MVVVKVVVVVVVVWCDFFFFFFKRPGLCVKHVTDRTETVPVIGVTFFLSKLHKDQAIHMTTSELSEGY